MANKISRSKLHENLRGKNSQAFKDIKDEAQDRKLPFEAVLRKKADGPESGAPSNIVYDLMAREGILPQQSTIVPSVKVDTCFNTPFRANLLFAHWDKVYDNMFWGQANRTLISTTDEMEPGSIYRPYTESRNEVVNRNRISPTIGLSNLIAQTITQEDDLVRGSGFEVDESAGNLVNVSQRGTFPEISFTVDQDASGMQKIGFSLASSREAKLREMYVQQVDRVVEQVAALQEQALAVQAAKQIVGALDTEANPKQTGVPENMQGVIQVNTSAKNGYSIDTLIMGQTQFRAWLLALSSLSGPANTTFPGTENRVPGLFGPTRILNPVQNANGIGYFLDDDLTEIGLAAQEMVGFDRASTLDFYMQTRGMVDEEEYLVSTQEWKRVVSMTYGQKIFDRKSIQVFVTA